MVALVSRDATLYRSTGTFFDFELLVGINRVVRRPSPTTSLASFFEAVQCRFSHFGVAYSDVSSVSPCRGVCSFRYCGMAPNSIADATECA
jgi:hypothetical protein